MMQIRKFDNKNPVFHTITYEALIDFKKVGYIVMHPGCKDGTNLANLFVDPEFRRQGIADDLLKYALLDRSERVYLSVIPYGAGDRMSIESLKRFYTKHGFKEEGAHFTHESISQNSNNKG